MQEKITQLKELIKKSNNILLINHIRMDPDAFWSLTAFYYILEKIWKDVKAINNEQRPDSFSFLDENQIFETSIKNFYPDLIISFDVASTGQLWKVYEKNKILFQNTTFIVIDHHITNDWFWTLNIINPKYSSTCELLYDLINEINLAKYIDNKIANLLMAWILTDTNVFYNTNVSPNTFKVAWELLNLWANSRNSIFEFFKKKSIIKTKLLGKALLNIKELSKTIYNKKIRYTILIEDDLKEIWASDRDTNWIIEHIINIENTEIAFIIYPLDKWWYKISFRSHKYDVSKIAELLWWWWHKQAAWSNLQKNITDTLIEIENYIDN